MNKTIKTKHGNIELPAFLPDATYGSINSTSFSDAKESGINEIVTTTLHIELNLGSDYIKEYGGLHKFFKWDRPILTDSGGFQVLSLIHNSKIKGNKITEEGCFFKNPKNGDSIILTPEKSQQIQHNLGSDIRIVLDEPTPPNLETKRLEESVKRTTSWAKRSKIEFLRLHNLTEEQFNDPINNPRPLLMAVVQGGNNFDLRKRSYTELAEIGFDGYNWGGATYEDGKFYSELGAMMGEMIDKEKIAYAMGVGTPDDILECIDYGWDMFDCVLPTRNARHGYIYVNKGVGDIDYKNFGVMHLKNEMYKFDEKPIEEHCQCKACKTASRAYIRYLIKIQEPAGFQLATIHNLHFYAELMKKQE